MRSHSVLSLLLLLGGLQATASAQSGRPEVRPSTYHDVSPPLRELPPGPRSVGALEAEPVRRIPSQRNASFGPDPLVRTSTRTPTALAPATSANFDGIGQGFTGPAGTFTVNSAPPDTNAAVGPNHIVETVNTDFAVFDKTGTPVFGPVPMNTLWGGFGGGCQTNNDGDPIVSYDRIADRWIISQFQVTSQPFQQCVAVSTTPDPTGSYNRYAFTYPDGFPDYPKLGVWPDAYYITYNMFNNAGTAFLGAKVCAFDRATMQAGAAATQQCFNTSTAFGGLLPGDVDGSRLPPAGAPNPVVALGTASTTLAAWRFHVDWTNPANTTFTGPITLTVPAYTEACGASGTCIPQSGGGSLDALSDRLMYRYAYRNFADGHQSLVVNHAVMVGSGAGIRWYELRLDAANIPSVFQAGTHAPDAAYRWMGSAAMDQAGNIALGFSASSSSTKPSIRYTGRLAGDPAGTMPQGEGTIITGAGAQGSSLSRWGDYSSLAIDPVDDCTFWYANEYIPANGTFNWKTRLASFKFPGCGATATNDFALSVTPTSITLNSGSIGTVTVATSLVSGAAESIALSISGVPAGATASFSPSTVTAGGGSTLTLDAGTAAAGTYLLTVTGTAPSATHSTAVSLTVTGVLPPDFGLAVSPASGSVAQGGTAAYTVTTTAMNGSTQAIALSVSGLPTGVTGAFAPATVTAGGTSTLTLSAAANAAPTTATFTVTGTSGAVQHTASASVSVTAAGATPLTDGVPVTNISGASGSQKFWVLDVPAGKDTLTFTISGGSGDADLYVRFGSLPTTTQYNCRPYLFGNNETCTFNAPAAGAYYVMIRGFSAYSGVTLTGRTSSTQALVNGVPVTNISGASGSQQFWKLSVPAGKTSLTFTISGGTGDADLYVRLGAKPTTSTYSCRPFLTGNNETCTFTNPAAGDWYVMIRGFTSFSGVTLKGTYTP